MDLQTLIIQNIIHNEEYGRKVLPYLKKKYFEAEHREVFNHLIHFVTKYNKIPDESSFLVEVQDSNVTAEDYGEIAALAKDVFANSDVASTDWLLDKTEMWCQDSACELAALEAVKILNGQSDKYDKGMIPQLFRDALGVTFDNSVGHDYFDDAEKRWLRYHDKADKIPFGLDTFNSVTDGGFEKGTLNIFIAGVHVGKSLMMASMAADALMAGKRVLYISMEMAEEKVGERIDANLMNREISDLADMDLEDFMRKVNKIKSKTDSNLIVRQYPTAGAHVGHFRALMEELKLKKNFVPDVVFVDYLNICTSERIRSLADGGLYTFVKSIAEELRGFAIEYQVPVWSATQFTRSGMNNSSDPSMTDTSESIGLPATVDLMWALSQPPEMKENNQYLVTQLKNRYKNLDFKERFIIGVNKPKMQVFDLDEDASYGLLDSNGDLPPQPEEPKKDFEFNFE